MSIRGRVDDVRRVRVRAYALWRDAYARACVPSRLRQAHVDGAGHRANARACALLLRAYVRAYVRVYFRVWVLSLSSLLFAGLKIVKCRLLYSACICNDNNMERCEIEYTGQTACAGNRILISNPLRLRAAWK